ncbi:M48 family metallopeptidase [Cupriavidus basilensis]
MWRNTVMRYQPLCRQHHAVRPRTRRQADYTIARTRPSMLEVLAGAGLLIVLTMLGGLQWINQFLRLGTFGPGHAYSVALIASVAVIGGLVDLPFSLYGQFGIEQRFGFNRMSLEALPGRPWPRWPSSAARWACTLLARRPVAPAGTYGAILVRYGTWLDADRLQISCR